MEKALIAVICIVAALSLAAMFWLVRTLNRLHDLEKLPSSRSSGSQRTVATSANVFSKGGLSDSGRGRRGISGGGSDVLSTITGKTETNETVITYV
jgi:hypothetical protein